MAQIIIINRDVRQDSPEKAFKLLAQLQAVSVMEVHAWRLSHNELTVKAKLVDIFIENNPDGIVLVLT